MWRPEIRATIDEYAANESLYLQQNVIRLYIQKTVFKDQTPRKLCLVAGGDHRKTVKVMKVLRIKFALVTGLPKGIVMARNSRCLLVRHGDHHRSW